MFWLSNKKNNSGHSPKGTWYEQILYFVVYYREEKHCKPSQYHADSWKTIHNIGKDLAKGLSEKL